MMMIEKIHFAACTQTASYTTSSVHEHASKLRAFRHSDGWIFNGSGQNLSMKHATRLVVRLLGGGNGYLESQAESH